MQSHHQVFNQDSFTSAFLADLRTARASVLIQSPFITPNKISRLKHELAACIGRGVQICVFVQRVDDAFDDAEQRRQAVMAACNMLNELSVHVSLRQRIHEKLAVIDEAILWDGSLNILSHVNTYERMTRWNDRSKVAEAVSSHNLNHCDICRPHRSDKRSLEDLDARRRKELGRLLVDRRVLLNMSQHEVAALSGVNVGVLCRLERGTQDAKLSTLLKLCCILRVEIRLIPQLMLGAVDRITSG